MSLFDIEIIAFEVLNYPISYVELIATLFGLISVYFATRANIFTWSTGIVNELFLFILFFQVQLYADMFLQVYFFVITLFGWYNWENKSSVTSISTIDLKSKLWLSIIIMLSSLIVGYLFSIIHLYLPVYFKIKASYPYADSFVMVLSIIATVLLATKKIETWYLWILVDLVCVFLFYKKGIVFLSLEYFVFLCLATFGLLNWKRQISNG
jgi:nicotinamide mononucleotide transporter